MTYKMLFQQFPWVWILVTVIWLPVLLLNDVTFD